MLKSENDTHLLRNHVIELGFRSFECKERSDHEDTADSERDSELLRNQNNHREEHEECHKYEEGARRNHYSESSKRLPRWHKLRGRLYVCRSRLNSFRDSEAEDKSKQILGTHIL